MHGIAWERVDYSKRHEVQTWLKEFYGPPSTDTWFIDQDYDLLTLCMNEEISTLYYLKWP